MYVSLLDFHSVKIYLALFHKSTSQCTEHSAEKGVTTCMLRNDAKYIISIVIEEKSRIGHRQVKYIVFGQFFNKSRFLKVGYV